MARREVPQLETCTWNPVALTDDVRDAVSYAADVLEGDLVFPHRAA